MQNLNINYVIGVFVLAALGWLGYVIFQGDEVQDTTGKTQEARAAGENNLTKENVINQNGGEMEVNGQIKKEENKKLNMQANNTKQESYKVTMNTNYGKIILELDGKKAPITAYNFAQIARAGGYDGVKFHRIIKGFMIQGGDPLTKDDSMQHAWGTGGTGWDGKKFDYEKSGISNTFGTISMANTNQPFSNGSQFFINTNNNSNLDPLHTAFGKVISGMDVVVKIENVKTLFPGQLDRPEQPVVINSVVVE